MYLKKKKNRIDILNMNDQKSTVRPDDTMSKTISVVEELV